MKKSTMNLKAVDIMLQLVLLIVTLIEFFILKSFEGFYFLAALCIYQLISNCIHLYYNYNTAKRKPLLKYMLICWPCILSVVVPAFNGNNPAAYILICLGVFIWIPMTLLYVLWHVVLTIIELSRIKF